MRFAQDEPFISGVEQVQGHKSRSIHTHTHTHWKTLKDSTQLTWLMCLSLSMIWLMMGSGGLLFRDSEPWEWGRFGLRNLTGQEQRQQQKQQQLGVRLHVAVCHGLHWLWEASSVRDITHWPLLHLSKIRVYHHLVLISCTTALLVSQTGHTSPKTWF